MKAKTGGHHMENSQFEIVEHKNCRLCGSAPLREAFSIGNQYINDFVEKKVTSC